jgi:DNA-binding NarL/FixJ family response regulator
MTSTAVAPLMLTAPASTRPRLRVIRPAYEVGDAAPTRDVSVLIAAGHALLRAGYRALLENAAGISIAGEAINGDEAVRIAASSGADVVLLEARIPGGVAVESIREIARLPTTSVIVVTDREQADFAFTALRSGASGFLLTDCEPGELVGAVRAVAGGDVALSPSVTRRLIARFAAEPDVRSARDGLEELTRREREAMALAARGLNDVEIGESLTVTRATARTHVNRARTKLRARDRAQLVAFAYRSGLVASHRAEPASMQ